MDPLSKMNSPFYCKKTFSLWIISWLLSALLISCMENPPAIEELAWHINIQFPAPQPALKNSNAQDPEHFESLSIFALVHDEDGIEDLGSMYILKENEDLFWALNAGNWSTQQIGNRVWVGSNNLHSAHLRKVPRGQYSVQIYDLAGRSARQQFQLTLPQTDRLAEQIEVPPVGKEFRLSLPKTVSYYTITGYTPANKIVHKENTPTGSKFSLLTLQDNPEKIDKVILRYSFPASKIRVILGPYPVIY